MAGILDPQAEKTMTVRIFHIFKMGLFAQSKPIPF